MTSQALNRPVDVIGVLDAAGANPYAEEGSPAWNLARLGAVVTEVVEALSDCVTDMQQTEDFYGTHPRAQEVIAKAKAALAAIEVRP